MKRKVIQIANSTKLISLPIKWCREYGIKKGEELDLDAQGSVIKISTEKGFEIEKEELDISGMNLMIPRYIYALYKKGVDELKIIFNKIELVKVVEKALEVPEVSGFEIVSQGTNHCIIKNVSGELEEFDSLLRRTFLLMISMAEEGFQAIKEGNFSVLNNIAFLEQTNNRLTTSCRRSLNKRGYNDPRKTGPIYYIIEDLENLADEFKYMYNYLYQMRNKKMKISKDTLDMFKEINNMLKDFYDVFYKFEKDKFVGIAKKRKDVVKRFHYLMQKSPTPADTIVLHHLFVIMQKIFCFLGPVAIVLT